MSAAVARTAHFDLHQLSIENYRRHRKWRIGVATLGIGIVLTFVVFGIIGVLGIPTRDDAALVYFTLGCGFFVGWLLFALCWWAVRLLAPGPVGLGVDRAGMTFALPDGQLRFREWRNPELWVSLHARPDSPGHPAGARFWMRLMLDNGEVHWPWRSIVPITYLPAGAIQTIVEIAEEAGLEVERVDAHRPFSLSPSVRGTSYFIRPTARGPEPPAMGSRS